MKKITIIGVVVVIVALGAWFMIKGGTKQEVSKLDTVDTVNDFYGKWLKAVQDPTNTTPNRTELAKSSLLSKKLSDRLVSSLKQSDVKLDPVLCQSVVPQKIGTRIMSELKDKSQILVTSRDEKVTEQAVVTLLSSNGGWYIDEIECSAGDFEAPKEFSFEKEGFLLKTSIPKPYNSKNWHLVFEENGEKGHVVPLFFDKDSQCTNLDGAKAVCTPDKFTETAKASIHGQMGESGVTVKKLEFVK